MQFVSKTFHQVWNEENTDPRFAEMLYSFIVTNFPGEFGEADHPAIIVVQCSDQDTTPEDGTFFAQPSTDMSRPSFPYCKLDQLFGQACLPVLWQVEQAKILPKYLMLLIPFYQFCS